MDSLIKRPAYTVADTGRLIGLTPGRIRRWLHGYSYEWGPPENRKHGSQPPVIKGFRKTGERLASFLDLMELLFAKSFLDSGVSLRKVRTALEEAKQFTKSDHPFASHQFYAWGKGLVLELPFRESPVLVELLTHGQTVIRPVVLEHALKIDFETSGNIASAWWPQGKGNPVVLNPKVCFGAPSIVGRGIKTNNVFDMYIGEGGDVDAVCSWFEIDRREVLAAVEFEENLRSAA